MGTWGVHSFDNDSAADLLAALADADQPYKRVEAVRAALTEALAEAAHGELDADKASKAVGAAEVIAAALGEPQADGEADPFDLAGSVRVYEDSVGMALAVLAPVRGAGSELAVLWDDGDEAAAWQASIADLEGRLRKGAEAHGLSTAFAAPTIETPPEAAERNEAQKVYLDIIDAFNDEFEQLADRNKGDPSVEVLRQLGRSVFRMQRDISNLKHAATDSIDALAERIKRLEGRLDG